MSAQTEKAKLLERLGLLLGLDSVPVLQLLIRKIEEVIDWAQDDGYWGAVEDYEFDRFI